jgi:hypothetical protein
MRSRSTTPAELQAELNDNLLSDSGMTEDEVQALYEGEVDLDDLTSGPRPWLDPNFPSNCSVLPVQLTHVQRKFPFPVTLETTIPIIDTLALETDPPRLKSKLTVTVAEMGLDELQEACFLTIVGRRFNPKQGTVSFVSRDLPTRQANENRVFQFLESTFHHAKLIGTRFEQEGTN